MSAVQIVSAPQFTDISGDILISFLISVYIDVVGSFGSEWSLD